MTTGFAAAIDNRVATLSPGEWPVRWSFLLFVFSLPYDWPSGPFPIAVTSITALLFLGICFMQPRVAFNRAPNSLWFFGAYLWLLACTIVIGYQGYAAEIINRFIVIALPFGVFWAAFNLLRDPDLRLKAWYVFVVAAIGRAMIQVMGIGLSVTSEPGEEARIVALGEDPNRAGAIQAIALLALIDLSFGKSRGVAARRLLILGAIPIVLCIVQGGSRSAMLALGAGLVVKILIHTPWSRRWSRWLAIVVLCAAVPVVLSNESVIERFEGLFVSGDTAGRTEILSVVVDLFKERPVVGWGPIIYEIEVGKRYGIPQEAHNMIGDLMAQSGLMGLVPFMIGFTMCMYRTWQARKVPSVVGPFEVAITALVIHLCIPWLAHKTPWFILAYGVAIEAGRKVAPHTVRNPGRRGASLESVAPETGNGRAFSTRDAVSFDRSVSLTPDRNL